MMQVKKSGSNVMLFAEVVMVLTPSYELKIPSI